MDSDVKYNKTFINKLPLNQSADQFIIVESKWLSDEIIINVLEYKDNKNPSPSEWRGTFQIDQIKATSEALERPYDEIYAECKNALCFPNGLTNFIYTIDSEKFIWKKDTGGPKIIYGRVALTKLTENLHLQFLLNSLDLCSNLRVKLEAKELKIAELDAKHRDFIEKYDKYVIEKAKHDDDLMKKFLLLLNNKKSKIAELKELLYEKSSMKHDSLLLSLSDPEQDSPKTGDEISVHDVPVAAVPARISEDLANDSSESQELLGFTIPKRKQPALQEIEKTVKVRIQEEVLPEADFGVDSQVYEVDTQKLLEDM